MQAKALSCAMRVVAVLAASSAFVPAARAQDVRITAPATGAETPAHKPLSSEEADLLGQALIFDPLDLTQGKPARSFNASRVPKRKGIDISRNDRPDGSGTFVVKKPLSSEWDARIGADINFAPPPTNAYDPQRPLPGSSTNDHGSGAAWAEVGVVPDFATVDARVDPANDQGRLGTTFKHTVPVGQQVSVTLQDRYSVTETYGQPSTTTTTGGLPLHAAPAAPPPPGAAQVWGNERQVKLNVLPSGTTFAAGVTSASNDPVTHHTLSAEQKVVGPLHVRTSVTDVGQPTANKSVSAGFKLSW